jgi:hypothetical protein
MPRSMSEPTRQPPDDGSTDTVDFGYEQVAAPEKAKRVRAVFDSVAG